MLKNTAFITVPGGFCPGSYFHKVTARLESLGYPVMQLDNPSVGKSFGRPATFSDDVAAVDDAVTNFVNQGKDVVIVGNSYGGFVITEAGKGLSKAERQANGKPGGIIHLVYLSSLFPPAIGMSCLELVGDIVPVNIEGSDYLPPIDGPLAGSIICSDLDEKEQKHYGGLQDFHSAIAMKGRLTRLAYEFIPSTMIISSRDKAVPPQLMKDNFESTKARNPKEVDMIEIDADHCSMISKPDIVVEILLHAAGIKAQDE